MTLAAHESAIGDFYGRYPYPWRPRYFDTVDDPLFAWTMLRQETGRTELAAPQDVWVAGCGTNQALMVALQYPEAQVLGTDVSVRALEICRANANDVGVDNLRLDHQGLLASTAVAAFDLVVCTGVVHHNPDPAACLKQLAAALRDTGVLELMVYNRFHRREPVAFQQAQRILLGTGDHADRVAAARALAGAIDEPSTLTRSLAGTASLDDAAWADSWLNPYELSWDVDGLWALAASAGLVIDAPRVNPFDKAADRFRWNLELADPGLARAYRALDDRARWQLVNLLHLDRAPMLWFYLRPDRVSSGGRVTEAERDEQFLAAVPRRPDAMRRRYRLDDDQRYRLGTAAAPIGRWPPPAEFRALWAAADGRRTTREIFAATGTRADPDTVYRARLMLTSAEFPHLVLGP